MKILNLGCGKNLIRGATNVDIMKGEGVDEIVDLTKFPWKWKSNSVEGIYLIHSLEHFPDQIKVIKECYRILKRGGFLYIVAPHSSSVMSIGCMGHYRTYSYDTFRDYLSQPFYLFKKKMFNTTHQKLNWWYARPVVNVPKYMLLFIIPMNYIFTRLANLNPRVCENLWCYWVGGFREIEWRGEKV